MAAPCDARRHAGLFTVPIIVRENKDLAQAGVVLHRLGQWVVCGVVALHLAATAWHITVPRDGVLDRMLPVQRDGA